MFKLRKIAIFSPSIKIIFYLVIGFLIISVVLPSPLINETIQIRTASNITIDSNIIFTDDFEDGSLGSDWTLTGQGGVGTQTANSGIYSAYHYGSAGSITSRIIDLSSYGYVYVSYWVRRGHDSFSENPDNGEDLVVEYNNSLGNWVQLDYFLGFGTPGEIYIRSITLPSDALHENFRIRFRQVAATSGNWDYWHFDDVQIVRYIATDLFSFQVITDESIGLVWLNFRSSITRGSPLQISTEINSSLPIQKVIAVIRKDSQGGYSYVELFDDGAHGDGASDDDIFGGTWDSSNMPVGKYILDLSIVNINNEGKLYSNAGEFSINPSFFEQYSWLIGIIIGIAILAVEAVLLVKYRPTGLKGQMKALVPKWRKKRAEASPQPIKLSHPSGERPLNIGISISECPKCHKSLPFSVRKKVELGYRVYCPHPGCFYPLHTT